MNAVLDIIIVCIIIFCVYMGYKKGLVKTVMSLLSFVLAYMAAKMFSPPLSVWLGENWVKQQISDIIEKNSPENINGAASGLADHLDIAQGVSDLIAFAAVFIAVTVLLKIGVMLISAVLERIKVLNFLNKAGGTVAGALYGTGLSYIFVILAVIAVYYILPNVSGDMNLDSAKEMIDGSIFFKWILENSPVKFI